MTPVELESLIIRLVGDDSSYKKMMKDAQTETRKTATSVESSALRIQSFKNSLRGFAGQVIAGVTAAAGGIGMLNNVFKGVHLAADMEQMEISFKTLTGSAETGQKTIASLAKFAAETPFELPEIVGAGKQMLAFGSAAEEIVPTMQSLGDISAGLGVPLGELTYLFGTLKSQGRAFTVDINQFAMRGVPIWDQLGKQFGKTNAEVREMVEKGKVGFGDVERAFQAMTSSGGRFFGLMKDQSISFTGLASTMNDALNALLRNIGKEVIELFRLKEVMQTVTEWAEAAGVWFKELSPTVKTVAFALAAIGIAVGTLMVVWPVLAAAAGSFLAAAGAILAFFMGPWGIAIATVGALVAVFVTGAGGIEAAWEVIRDAGVQAWEWIQARAEEFWSWFRPIWKAAEGLAVALWEKFQQGAAKALEWSKELYNFLAEKWTQGMEFLADIVGDFGYSWAELGKDIRDAFIIAEWAIRNFDAIAEYAFVAALYHFVKFQSQVEHFFSKVVPAALEFFGENWETIFSDIFNFTYHVFDRLVHNVVDIMSNLPGLIDGSVAWGDVWKPLTEGFEAATKEMVLPERVISELESDLEREMKRQGNALQQSLEEFMGQRWDEIGMIPPDSAVTEAQKEAGKAAKKVGEEMNKGLQKEVQKMDAALVGSAEAFSRIADYRERMGMRAAFQAAGPANVAGGAAPGIRGFGVGAVAGAVGSAAGYAVGSATPLRGSSASWNPIQNIQDQAEGSASIVDAVNAVTDAIRETSKNQDRSGPKVVLEPAGII